MNNGIIYKSVAHLGTKRFSNKYYSMQIEFYEHNMAVADITCKKRNYAPYSRVSFDECKVESMYDYFDCLEGLAKDKVARKWFIREMKYCTNGFLTLTDTSTWNRQKRLRTRYFIALIWIFQR